MVEGKIEKLAVLIDADNAQPSIVDGLLSEIAKYGTANVKRIYGDWTLSGLKGWKEVLLEYSIQPIQQFGYTSGKNATDSALIIDAMDLLYTDKFDGFCIVSSDSDFTKLASRIREAGLFGKSGLKVEMVPPLPQKLEKVHAGDFELAINYPHNILLMRKELPNLISVGSPLTTHPTSCAWKASH